MKKLIFISIVAVFAAVPALAQDGAAAGGHNGLVALAAGLTAAIAAFGAALGQGRALSAAMDGISRNPAAQQKMFIPLMIGLAFIEALFILSWVIANGLAGKA